MPTTYRPGRWHAIVRPGALVALPPDASADVVTRLWETTAGQPTLATVIDVLTSQAGGVLAALPPFVAAVAEGADLRIALRGDVTARVSGGAGEQELSGADVSTWSERFAGGATRIEITLETADDAAALPVESGAVRAATVDAELRSGEREPQPTTVVAEHIEAVAEADAGPGGTVAGADVEPDEQTVTDVEPDEQTVTDVEPGEQTVTEVEAAVIEDGAISPSEVTLAPSSEDFDQLWGATILSAPAVDPGPDLPPADPSASGDHDGATISVAELRALRDAPAQNDAPTAVLPVATGAAGRVRVSTGQVVTLDRTVIIGRRPRSTRASGANLPRLIAVESPQQDISRSHLEIRPEADTVVVIDLHTTNGSTLLRPGADPMRLHPGEQTLVLSGDVVDLGDGVTVAFEDLP